MILARPKKDFYSGDPKILLTEEGADLKFVGGQPVLDRGLENHAMISLFTREGWFGNDLIDDKDKKIGSDFEEISGGAITLSSLNLIRQTAEAALAGQAFETVAAEVKNTSGLNLSIKILLQPPGQSAGELTLTKNGPNWIAQANDPASARI